MEKILADVEGLGKITEVYGDFYSELQQLKEANARLISPRDEAYARIRTEGKENIGRSEGTRTTGGFEYVKKELPIFRVKSRLTNLRLAKLAVEANRAGNYFHTESKKEYQDSLERAEKDKNREPEKRNVIILPSRDNFEITPEENWEVLQTALGEQAEKYFALHKRVCGDVPITCYLVDKDKVNKQNETLLTHLWFWDLGLRSGLYGGSRGLDCGLRTRGILKETGEASSQKVSGSLPYTQRQLDKYSKIIKGVRQGNIPASKLEKVIQFFENLKQ